MKCCDGCGVGHTGSCNWLDAEKVCPHCGGELRQFKPTALGAIMDSLSIDQQAYIKQSLDQCSDKTLFDQLVGRRWKCPFCHDEMEKKFRRSHLAFEKIQRMLRKANLL